MASRPFQFWEENPSALSWVCPQVQDILEPLTKAYFEKRVWFSYPVFAVFMAEMTFSWTFFKTDFLENHFVNSPILSRSPAWDEGFHIPLSADETSPALAAPRHAITAPFSCCFKCACPPGWQPHFRSNADRAYNTLHFASKAVCQGVSPFGNPRQQNRLNISHFPGAWYSAFICCQQPRSVVCV